MDILLTYYKTREGGLPEYPRVVKDLVNRALLRKSEECLEYLLSEVATDEALAAETAKDEVQLESAIHLDNVEIFRMILGNYKRVNSAIPWYAIKSAIFVENEPVLKMLLDEY